MKKLTCLFVLFLLNITGLHLKAQAPGYLNKRMSAGLGVRLGLAPNYNYNNYNDDYPSINFNFTPEFNYFYKENRVLSGQLTYTRYSLKTEPLYDSYGSFQKEILPSISIYSYCSGFNVGLKMFNDNLAPVGKYFSVRIGVSRLKMTNYKVVNYTYNKPEYVLSTSTKFFPQFIFSWGKQRVFFKRFIFDRSIGGDIGSLLALDKYYWSKKFVSTNVFFVQLGASYMF